MDSRFMKLLFPQWQGSGNNKDLYNGVKLIQEHLLKDQTFNEIQVSLDVELVEKNNIIGYDYIYSQLAETVKVLEKEKPDKIFLIGGDCGTELAPVTYLNKKLGGDLNVLWLDAHGDLNTPESSPSKAFHGMPLRAILGEGDSSILDLCFSKLSPKQVSLVGGRDFDRPEIDYIRNHNMENLPIDKIKKGDVDLNFIKEKGYNNIYIHLDLDVLDPESFPHVMLPVSNGFDFQSLLRFINDLKNIYNVVGYSIQEFSPLDSDSVKLLKELVDYGLNIG